MISKNCKHCGKEFTATNNAQGYCSVACKREARKKSAKKKKHWYTCKVCGCKFLHNRKSDYCSVECKRHVKPAASATNPKVSLAEANALARAEGLTYGQYFNRYGYRKD